MSRSFCRDICLAADEPLAGTGRLLAGYLALRWPRGKWRSPREDSLGLGPELSAAIRAATAAGLHVSLVERPGDTGDMPDLWDPMTGAAIHRATPPELAAAIDRRRLGGAIAAPWDGPGPMPATLMVCTDSRRDPCCARYGNATWKALEARADPARFRILQTTHLGGCRFAASLVVLPARQRYGRLDAAGVPAFLADIAAGRIHLPAFRGTSGLTEPEQVAEAALLQLAGGQTARLDPAAAWCADPGAAAGVLTGRIGDRPVRVALHRRDHLVHNRCAAIDSQDPERQRRWHVGNISCDADPGPADGTPQEG